MPLYMRLLRLTTEGINNFKDSPKKFEEMEKIFEKHDAKLTHCWVTNGKYDIVSVIEAPDDNAMKKIGAEVARMGLYTGHTMSALPMSEFNTAMSAGGNMALFMEHWFKSAKNKR